MFVQVKANEVSSEVSKYNSSDAKSLASEMFDIELKGASNEIERLGTKVAYLNPVVDR